MRSVYGVDRQRIYLTGKSLGGMIAATTAAKYPAVFAAVVEEQGATLLSRWYNEAGAWRQLKIWEEVGGTPQELPFEYQRRSASSMAQNLKNVPFAIIHGLQDEIVPVAHALDLHNAIQLYEPAHLEMHLFTGAHGQAFPGDDTMRPAPQGILDFLARYTLEETPLSVAIRTDESRRYYWLEITQERSWATRWTRVTAEANVGENSIEVAAFDERGLSSSLSLDLYALGFPLLPYMVEDYNEDTGAFRALRRDATSTGSIQIELDAGRHRITIMPWDNKPPSLITLQQGPDYAGFEDTYLHRWNPGVPYGAEGELAIKENMVNGLIRFDLEKALPPGTIVRAAQLRFYVSFGGGGAEVASYPVLRPWVEDQANWLQSADGKPWSVPGCEGENMDRQSKPYSQSAIPDVGGWCSLNVRELVQVWVDDQEANYGLLLKGVGANMYRLLSSECEWNHSLRPQLQIYAILPPATSTPTLTNTPMATATATPTPPPSTVVPTRTPLATPGVGILYGLVWEDADGDNRRSADEQTLPNAQIELRDGANALQSQQWTQANGLYRFSNLEPGLYKLCERPPPGYEPAAAAWTGWLDESSLREVNFGVRQMPSPTPTATAVSTPSWPKICLPIIAR